MRVYIAARYRRRDEVKRCAEDLQRLGHQVTSRWLHGHDVAPGPLDNPSWAVIAREDVEDTLAAYTVISFTDGRRGGGGGRHVEFGIGLGTGKRLIVVGPREHLFHSLPQTEVYTSWAEVLTALSEEP